MSKIEELKTKISEKKAEVVGGALAATTLIITARSAYRGGFFDFGKNWNMNNKALVAKLSVGKILNIGVNSAIVRLAYSNGKKVVNDPSLLKEKSGYIGFAAGAMALYNAFNGGFLNVSNRWDMNSKLLFGKIRLGSIANISVAAAAGIAVQQICKMVPNWINKSRGANKSQDAKTQLTNAALLDTTKKESDLQGGISGAPQ